MPQDDLDVLVGNRHALGPVDVLHLIQHVEVQRLFAPNSQNVVGNQRPFSQRVAGMDYVTGVDKLRITEWGGTSFFTRIF